MKHSPIFLLLALISGGVYAGAPVLSDSSYGKITFGQQLQHAEEVLHEKAPPIKDADETHCRYVTFKLYPNISFMVENSVITRAESSTAVPTSKGITVGASLALAKSKGPSAIEPHHYNPAGHYVIFKSKNKRSALLLEEDNGVVTNVRGGLVPSVEYVEGCL